MTYEYVEISFICILLICSFDFPVFLGANEPQYNWDDITDNFTVAASGKK